MPGVAGFRRGASACSAASPSGFLLARPGGAPPSLALSTRQNGGARVEPGGKPPLRRRISRALVLAHSARPQPRANPRGYVAGLTPAESSGTRGATRVPGCLNGRTPGTRFPNAPAPSCLFLPLRRRGSPPIPFPPLGGEDEGKRNGGKDLFPWCFL